MSKVKGTKKQPLGKEEKALLKLFLQYHDELIMIDKKLNALERKVQQVFDRQKAKKILSSI